MGDGKMSLAEVRTRLVIAELLVRSIKGSVSNRMWLLLEAVHNSMIRADNCVVGEMNGGGWTDECIASTEEWESLDAALRGRFNARAVETFTLTLSNQEDPDQWPVWLQDAWSKGRNEDGAFMLALGDEFWLRVACGMRRVNLGDIIYKDSDGTLKACSAERFDQAMENKGSGGGCAQEAGRQRVAAQSIART